MIWLPVSGYNSIQLSFLKVVYRLSLTSCYDCNSRRFSLKDIDLYKRLHSEYDILSKKINKFIQWVEDNWNEFPDKETETSNR